MEKIIVIALLIVNVQLVLASCSSETATVCLDTYSACSMAAPNTTEAACTCYGFYLRCLLDSACITDSEYQNIVQTCTDSGCTRQQCLGGIDAPVTAPVSTVPVAAPVTFTPVPSSGCDYAVADACLSTYLSCVGSGSQEEICNCYGPYIYCYYYGAGCLTLDQYEEAVQYCIQFNCSVQQCNSAVSGPISYTPVQAPVQSPFPNTPVSSCDYNTVLPCQDQFVNCTNEAQSSDKTCDCYGPYFNCVYDTGCITSGDYWNAVNYCQESNCTLAQCTANSTVVPPPVEAPVTAPYATPYSEPTDNSTCSQSEVMTCYNKYESCANASGYCDCYGPYLYCLYEIQCFNSTIYTNVIDACAQSGCSYQQCSNTGVTPVSQAPVPIQTPSSSQCNSQSATVCANEYQSCVLSAETNTSAICSCYGPYFECLFDIDCLTLAEYQAIIQSCSQSGCTLQQCAGNSTIVAPAATVPVQAPVTSQTPSSSQCNSQSATVCANEYNTCVNVAGTNISSICNCYGPYFQCLFDVGCLTYSQYQNVVQNCAQSGCTLQQCIGNSTIIAPVSEAPTASAPIGPTPTSTSPVSAPFSAPSTVICLQPWELVLIVIGSLLAGVGLAAIIGVIIYLSRGRSSVKKTNKYAKLQQY